MTFIEKYVNDKEPGIKASAKQMIKLKNSLPKDVDRAIPFCLIDRTGNWNFDVLVSMAWQRALIDDTTITRDTIENMITVDNARDIAIDVAHYYSPLERSQVERLLKPIDVEQLIGNLEKKADELIEKSVESNPPPPQNH